MKRLIAAILLVLPILASAAGAQSVAKLADPTGDDNGDGRLIYPQRPDFQAGDLDLVSLEVSRDSDGYWFAATFRNPIRDPQGVRAELGPEDIARVARRGFYTFNIDIYVDTDRIEGSGNTFTLPGRHVRIERAYAWEKAIILTPRPEVTSVALLDALAEASPQRQREEIKAIVEKSIYFPTQVRVRGRTVSFLVPAAFFGDSNGSDWAITAFVTGARLDTPLGLSLNPFTPDNRSPLEKLDLAVMQPSPGSPKDSFGYPSHARPSPIVDLLAPGADSQAKQLAAGAALTGIAWGKHAGAPAPAHGIASMNVEATALQQLFAATSTGPLNPTPTPGISAPPVAGTQGVAPRPATNLSQPTAGTPAEAPSLAPAIARRLQALQQLYEQKLIDESEYKQQRQRILNEL